MGLFFIETDTGQVATLRQLIEAGITGEDTPPALPWHPIQGSRDASTLWYAVLRKRIGRRAGGAAGVAAGAPGSKYVYIGALAIRHQPHHASLLANGWEEVAVDEIGVREIDIADGSGDVDRGS